MSDIRLIERWLPIAEIGIESMRERTPMTPFPAPNRLHVWWARRPLVASRAAVLASLLPLDADRKAFLHAIGIHGDPVAAKARIAAATRNGERLGADAYGYGRAFKHPPDEEVRDWLASKHEGATVLDPTAGGGSIALEAAFEPSRAHRHSPAQERSSDCVSRFRGAGGAPVDLAQKAASVRPRRAARGPQRTRPNMATIAVRSVTTESCMGDLLEALRGRRRTIRPLDANAT